MINNTEAYIFLNFFLLQPDFLESLILFKMLGTFLIEQFSKLNLIVIYYVYLKESNFKRLW